MKKGEKGGSKDKWAREKRDWVGERERTDEKKNGAGEGREDVGERSALMNCAGDV